MTDVVRRVMVSGRVQGVGYRNFVFEAATAQRLQGWVRNRMAGTVEAVLIDWQMTGWRNPMHDVGYFLSGSVTRGSPEPWQAAPAAPSWSLWNVRCHR